MDFEQLGIVYSVMTDSEDGEDEALWIWEQWWMPVGDANKSQGESRAIQSVQWVKFEWKWSETQDLVWL